MLRQVSLEVRQNLQVLEKLEQVSLEVRQNIQKVLEILGQVSLE
ncbi:hypothetical protein E2C01_070359 [Portunus trituberculatus]|uniref:Uncharacterized protein n=1 Tax=Portunus trituberculatus TaxID=210409 RepID=A0A5B7I516_PORTR|nr:hypothetical protein [Portunus trituberculatus]